MTPENVNASPGSRSARLRALFPIAVLVGGLTVFLALFWHPGGHGRKGHGRSGSGSTADRDRSPVGGSRDESNARVSSGGRGGSPVGGGPSHSRSEGKGDTWWYKDGKQRRSAEDDAWWAPGSDGRKSEANEASARGGSPVGGSDAEDRAQARRDREDEEAAEEREEREARKEERPARASSSNPGEVAGQRGGPDDYWWRK